jgi:hypothetical protein
MEIAPEQLAKFQALYREKFNIELTPQEALEKGLSLLTLMKAIYLPMTDTDLKNVTDRHRTLPKPT